MAYFTKLQECISVTEFLVLAGDWRFYWGIFESLLCFLRKYYHLIAQPFTRPG